MAGSSAGNLTSPASATGPAPATAPGHGAYPDDEVPWPNHKSEFIGFLIPLMVLAWISLGLRLYTRFRVVRAPGWDDLFIVLAQVMGLLSAVSLATATNYGMGHHIYEVPQGDLDTILLLYYLSNASFNVSNSLVKVSLLVQYLRAFVEPMLRRLCIGLTAITAAYGIAFGIISWAPCIPVEGFWRRELNAYCYAYGSTDENQVYLTVFLANIINMALDIMTFLLPTPLLFRADTQRNTKIGLSALFGLGIIINIIAGLRLASNQATSDQGAREDATFNLPRVLVLAEAENMLSCILASTPVFWPVVTRRMQQIFITREFRVESTHWSSPEPRLQWKGGGGGGDGVEMQAPRDSPYGKGGIGYQEDEVLESGVRHPGRLLDVGSYTRALVVPFRETAQDSQPRVVYEVKAEASPEMLSGCRSA